MARSRRTYRDEAKVCDAVFGGPEGSDVEIVWRGHDRRGDGCFRDVLGSQRGLVVLNRNVTHASFKTCQGRFFRPLSLLFQHVYSSISLFISYLVSVFAVRFSLTRSLLYTLGGLLLWLYSLLLLLSKPLAVVFQVELLYFKWKPRRYTPNVLVRMLVLISLR